MKQKNYKIFNQNQTNKKKDVPHMYTKDQLTNAKGQMSTKVKAKKTEASKDLIKAQAWQIAMSAKGMMMFLIILYFIPNSPSIITISLVAFMGLYNPLNAIFNVNNAFAGVAPKLDRSTVLQYKVVYMVLYALFVCVGLYKFSKFNLLPTKEADYAIFYGLNVPEEVVVMPF